MKTIKKMSKEFLGGGLIFLALLFVSGKASASHLTLNFDSVDASSGDVNASSYLAGFGISLTGVTPGTTVVILDNANVYGGTAAVPSSVPNYLTQVGSNDPVTFTLNFATPLNSFEFTRPKLLAGPNGITHPEWSAHAFNSGGVEVATVGESLIASFSDVPAKTFTMTKPNIASVRIDSNNRHFAAFSAVLIDDMKLAHTTPAQCPMDVSGKWVGKGVSITECCPDPSDNGTEKFKSSFVVTQVGNEISASWVGKDGNSRVLTGIVNGNSVYLKIVHTYLDKPGCGWVDHFVGIIKGNRIKFYVTGADTCNTCRGSGTGTVKIVK